MALKKVLEDITAVLEVTWDHKELPVVFNEDMVVILKCSRFLEKVPGLL